VAQLHFSVDAEIAERLEARARQQGTSLSRYLAQLVSREVGEAWPDGYLERAIGSCATDPLDEPADPPPSPVEL
jgi:hypothetical protein